MKDLVTKVMQILSVRTSKELIQNIRDILLENVFFYEYCFFFVVFFVTRNDAHQRV